MEEIATAFKAGETQGQKKWGYQNLGAQRRSQAGTRESEGNTSQLVFASGG